MKLLGNCLFISCCLVGCSYQIFRLANLFFRYDVNTDIYLEVPRKIKPPAISVCYRYIDILDTVAIFNDTGHYIQEDFGRSNASVDDVFAAQALLTTSQVFKYSPSAEHFIASCFIRSERDYNMDIMEKKDCYSRLAVDTFL